MSTQAQTNSSRLDARLDDYQIDLIVKQILAQGFGDENQQRIRELWPQYRFIWCSEDDMEDKPAYREFSTFSIFLMAASLGCACLCETPEQAIGLIVALHEEEW